MHINQTLSDALYLSSCPSILTVLLTADSVAQTGTDHLLTALVSEPALCVFVGDSGVDTTRPLRSVLGLLL